MQNHYSDTNPINLTYDNDFFSKATLSYIIVFSLQSKIMNGHITSALPLSSAHTATKNNTTNDQQYYAADD